MMQPNMIAGRYRVDRAIGKGGMGIVWLCHDQTLHRDVAVKQIGVLPGESPHDTARAMREARVTAALNHKSAVSVFDVVEHDGATWLVMEYVESSTLAELLISEGRLRTDRVAHIGAQVAAALSTAHGLGIVHRDIKPGNILVSEGDVAKISDFGIARRHQDLQLTQTGMVSGTPTYFSPELARGGDPSFASDVWALGATLYTAVEGSPPHKARSNPLAMLSAIAREQVPPPQHAGPLVDVLGRMLNPDADARCTMESARAALAEVVEGSATHQLPASMTGGVPRLAGSAPAGSGLANSGLGAAEPSDIEPESWTSRWVTGDDHVEPPLDDDRGRRSTSWWLVSAAALVLLVVVGLVLWSVLNPGQHQSAQPGDAPRGNQDSRQGDTSGTPNSSSTTDQTPSQSPPDEPKQTNQASFVQSYYLAVPADLDAGWAQLSPDFQAEIGRHSYDGFWNSVDSVDVRDVIVVRRSTVDYQITYHMSDGSTSTEQKQITLRRDGDSYLISGDETVG